MIAGVHLIRKQNDEDLLDSVKLRQLSSSQDFFLVHLCKRFKRLENALWLQSFQNKLYKTESCSEAFYQLLSLVNGMS